MIKINKEINLEQLDKELAANGLVASLDHNKNIIAIGLANNSTITLEELNKGIEKHKAIFTTPSIADKLQDAGISIDELKVALGLG